MSRQEFEALAVFAVLDTDPVFTSVADALREWVGIFAVMRPGVDALTVIGDYAPAVVRGYSPFKCRHVLRETREYSMDEIASILHDAHYEIFEENWNAEANQEEA